jgi:3-(3-hydroxy-phenyl)propionate hydroxylase
LCTTFQDRGHSAFPPVVNISQARTEAILDELVRASPLIDIRWGVEVHSIDQDDRGVTIGCRNARGPLELGAPYVIACGGAHSDKLRAALGLSFPGRTFDDHFLITDIRTDLPGWNHERRFYFDPDWNPGRQVLIHPCPNSTYRIDWQVPPEFDPEQEQRTGGNDRRIRQIIGDRNYEIVWRSVYRFHSRHTDRMRVGRVLIAGDMAHLVAPFGARGLNSGVPDAENAAWKIAFGLRGWAGGGLLESYHDERLAAALENIAVTTKTMDFLVPHSEQAWRHRREVLERALRDPAARAEVDSGRFAEPFWYIDSPLTTPHARTIPGRPPPGEPPPTVPGVLVPDAPIRITEEREVGRLRELVREGLLVLTTEGIDPAEAAATLCSVTSAPARTLGLSAIDIDGMLAAALQAQPHEAWLIRPDGHVAAVVADAGAELRAATERCLGADTVAPAGHI